MCVLCMCHFLWYSLTFSLVLVRSLSHSCSLSLSPQNPVIFRLLSIYICIYICIYMYMYMYIYISHSHVLHRNSSRRCLSLSLSLSLSLYIYIYTFSGHGRDAGGLGRSSDPLSARGVSGLEGEGRHQSRPATDSDLFC
jgi:hypothetical protein